VKEKVVNRSRAWGLIPVAAAAVLLSGCVSESAHQIKSAVPQPVPAAELTDVTLQVGDQKGGTESLLRAAGELDSLPYKVAFSTFTSGPPQIEAATAGKIDFAVTGNTPPIFGAASNAKIRIVSAYANTARGDQILIPADSPLRSVADLKGKKILVGKGSSAHGHLLLQLQRAGLTVKDVQLVFLQPADAITALSQDRADAWAIWDPYTALAAQQIRVRTLADATGVANGDAFGIASVAALQDAKRNSALSDFVQRVARASLWAQTHPDQWYEKYAAAIGIDPAVARTAQSRTLRLPIALDPQVIDSEQQLTDIFAASGQITSKPVFADFVDNRYSDVLAPYWKAPS